MLKIFENDEYIVYIPTNKDAACELGKGTEWSTAASGLNYYEQYHKEDDPFIIFKSKTDPKKDVQMHFGTEEFMDIEDEQIDDEKAISLARLLRGNKHLPKKILNIIKDVGITDLGGGRTVEVGLDGAKQWWLHDKRHREDGPAYEHPNGTKQWWLHGKLHRVNGPAVEWPDGTKLCYLDDKLHCEHGPAVEKPDGSKRWYLNGQNLTEEEHRQQSQPESTLDGKTVEINGKIYVLTLKE